MEKIITYENLRNFAYVNDKICKKPIKGIVLLFFGLGSTTMYANDTMEGEFYGDKGILYVVPYNNPWAWMNSQAVTYTDEIIDLLFEKYSLPEDTPIVSTGLSMGGMASLIYAKYSKRTPVACVSNCPVCDMVYHYTERPDLPRTIYSALFNCEGTLDEALRRVSPLHLASEMPKIKYHVFYCTGDTQVNPALHSEKFVDEMKKNGHNITLDIVQGRKHCDLSLEKKRLFADYILKAIEG